jgi:hypothetical protein
MPKSKRSHVQLQEVRRTKGLIFCKVSIRYKDSQSRFSPTETNHPWNGATPILIKSDTRTTPANREENLIPKMPIKKMTEATVCLRKYLTAHSPSRPVLRINITGIKVRVFSSIPTQHSNQEEEETTKKTLNPINDKNTAILGEKLIKKKVNPIVGV